MSTTARPRQQVRFCRADDGTRLAYAVHGHGPPLVLVSCWLSHLEHDWQSPVWQHFLTELGRFATVIRYDERGFGLSDWDVTDFSYETRLRDLELLMDEVGEERFAVMGMAAGAPVAIGYAVAHPDRVSQLILYGAFGGRPALPEDDEETEEAFLALLRAGWARPDPLFRRVFTQTFIPGANEEQKVWLDDLQRTSTSTENAVASRIARHEVDVDDLLPSVSAPTLVLHSRGDRSASFDWARNATSRIPDARLVPLESDNHILLADEPAWPVFVEEVREAMDRDVVTTRDASGLDELSAREREVLTLAADGLDNAAIAAAFTLSLRTVERHLQNVYAKLGLSGRNARSAAVARYVASTR